MRKLWAVLPIVAAVVALFFWTVSSQRDRAEAAKAPRPASQAQGWSHESKVRLRAEVAEHNAGKWPALLTTDDARSRMLDCFVEKLVAELPGGPAEWNRLASEPKRLQDVTARAGFDCGRELSERIARATSWSVDFVPVFVASCIQDEGEPLRAACACLAAEAPARFASPAEFMGALSTPRPARVAAQQQRLAEVLSKCAERAPDAKAFAAR